MTSISRTPRPIELLAPARDVSTALEAISHGADAVYIGASSFGARSRAGNTTDDIRMLCQRAHAFGVSVYVTLNTILRDDELDEAHRLACDLCEAGADALIVQDMAFLRMDLPPIPLHASTQMNNQSAAQVAWLRSHGFRQVVLARELTLDEIRAIHQAVPDVRLEAFVHGSICVSYNGQCYASQYCLSRSANRGECAQFCRLPFDLEDEEGHVLERQRHLLSLRDMNRSQYVEEMLDAGVTSLKIEGRLKDAAYVKNVVAHYRQRLDDIIRRRPQDYCRSSLGHHTFTFTPSLEKSFNRGFTPYFLHGRTPDMACMATPKSMGEPVGRVKDVGHGWLTVAGTASFCNGDGLCYLDGEGRLQGFRVNRAQSGRLWPYQMPASLAKGTPLYRNCDQQWERLMHTPTADRRIPLRWLLEDTALGFRLTATAEGIPSVSAEFESPHEEARTLQDERIHGVLSRLGGTPYECCDIQTRFASNWFIPSSRLTAWRNAVLSLITVPRTSYVRQCGPQCPAPFSGQHVTYLGNVSNTLARDFYLSQGATQVDWAMEVHTPEGHPLLMQTRYCVRHQLGLCGRPAARPLYLRLGDGRRFRLEFHCKECKMMVYAE